MTTVETDVLVVGAGITGAAAACALRDRGYRVVVVESRDPGRGLDTARGDHLQPFSIVLLERWGALDAFLARGPGKRYGVTFSTGDGDVLLVSSYEDLPLPYPYVLVVDHELIADTFLELAAASDDVTVLRPVAARRFAAADGAIEALDVALPDGREVRIAPKLVVGADGTGSLVRRAAGIDAPSYDYAHPFAVLFAPQPWPNPGMHSWTYLGPGGQTFVNPRMDGAFKITFPIRKAEAAALKRASRAELGRLVAGRAAALAGVEPELAGFFPIRKVDAARYASENVVLVGDARHSMHPIRGQGMNLGLRGVATLVEALPPPDLIGDRERLRAALAGVERLEKPANDELLAANHAHALEVDAMRDDATARVLDYVRRLGDDPELMRQLLWETTGYPPSALP